MKVNINSSQSQLDYMKSKSGKYLNPEKLNRDQAEEFFHFLERGAEGSGLNINWYKAFYSMYGIKSIGGLISFLFRVGIKYPDIKSDYDPDSNLQNLIYNKDEKTLDYIIEVYSNIK